MQRSATVRKGAGKCQDKWCAGDLRASESAGTRDDRGAAIKKGRGKLGRWKGPLNQGTSRQVVDAQGFG